jgi:hypothetical protein
MFGRHNKNRQEWDEQLALSRSARRLRDAIKDVTTEHLEIDSTDDLLPRLYETLNAFYREEEAMERRPRPRPQPTTTSVPVMPGWIVQ